MGFESVRAYLQLASGLSDLTRARAMEAAQGLLTLPVSSMATGTKVASQASALADELLAATVANRANLTALVRSEVDAAISRLGLVSVQKLEDAQAETAKLRKEVATLRSASPTADTAKRPARKTAAAKAAAKSPARKTAAAKAAAAKAPAKKAAAKAPATKAPSAKRTAKRAAAKAPAENAAVSTPVAAPARAGGARSAVTTRATTAGA